MASSTSSDPSSDYTRLLHGDQGYLLALAVTVLVILVATFIAKLYFSWRRFRLMKTAASTDHAALASDAMWLLGHLVAFAYIGLRISTLSGLTEKDSSSITSARQAFLASANEACQILFVLALYLSFCSVLYIVLAIPTAFPGSGIHITPLVVLLVGLLSCTLPHIGCHSRFIFQGQQYLCPSADARMLPSIVLVTALDTGVAIYWPLFVYHKTRRVQVGRATARQPWPVAPFILRFIAVGTNIAFIYLYVRFNARAVPYFATFYPELAAVLVSLTATSSVTMNRLLGKFNFVGVAYTAEPSRSRSQGQSGGAGSQSGTRTAANAPSQVQSRAGGAWALSSRDFCGWGDQCATLRSEASVHVPPRSGTESQTHMLPNNSVTRKVEIEQFWEDEVS